MTFAALTTGDAVFTNDAITVALMQVQGLRKIATSDSDFDRVPGLTRYGPV